VKETKEAKNEKAAPVAFEKKEEQKFLSVPVKEKPKTHV